MESVYETAVQWQLEQMLLCPCCGMPKEEAWVWDPDEQDEKEARASAMVTSRLCVYGQARAAHERRLRGPKSENNVDGFITTFELPTR